LNTNNQLKSGKEMVFALVYFKEVHEATKAIRHLHGMIWKNQSLTVKYAYQPASHLSSLSSAPSSPLASSSFSVSNPQGDISKNTIQDRKSHLLDHNHSRDIGDSYDRNAVHRRISGPSQSPFMIHRPPHAIIRKLSSQWTPNQIKHEIIFRTRLYPVFVDAWHNRHHEYICIVEFETRRAVQDLIFALDKTIFFGDRIIVYEGICESALPAAFSGHSPSASTVFASSLSYPHPPPLFNPYPHPPRLLNLMNSISQPTPMLFGQLLPSSPLEFHPLVQIPLQNELPLLERVLPHPDPATNSLVYSSSENKNTTIKSAICCPSIIPPTIPPTYPPTTIPSTYPPTAPSPINSPCLQINTSVSTAIDNTKEMEEYSPRYPWFPELAISRSNRQLEQGLQKLVNTLKIPCH
jgi:hypothetical protein